ncbi:MAG: HNH endonuclease [Rhizobiales bacterium]|nr:HNH endonuclease [Hyphomicrobiales bacterium]
MPNRITACGCSVPKGQRCQHEQARHVERQAATDAARGTPAQRGYDKDWFRLRHAHITAHPLCEWCGAPGEHVDHIQTIRDHPERRLDPTNLRTLCQPCHSRRTAKDMRR